MSPSEHTFRSIHNGEPRAALRRTKAPPDRPPHMPLTSVDFLYRSAIYGLLANIEHLGAVGAAMEITEAVRQQRIASEEIALNIQSAAAATQNVARNVAVTTGAIGESNHAATEVLEAAEYMTSHARDLSASVDRFLRDVAAA